MGTRSVRNSFASPRPPSGSAQSRAVLSSEPVAISVQAASTPMRLIVAVCIPGSMRRNTSPACGSGASAGFATTTPPRPAESSAMRFRASRM